MVPWAWCCEAGAGSAPVVPIFLIKRYLNNLYWYCYCYNNNRSEANLNLTYNLAKLTFAIIFRRVFFAYCNYYPPWPRIWQISLLPREFLLYWTQPLALLKVGFKSQRSFWDFQHTFVEFPLLPRHCVSFQHLQFRSPQQSHMRLSWTLPDVRKCGLFSGR